MVCLGSCIGTLFGGCGDCDACVVISVGLSMLREFDGDDNAGVGDGGGASVSIWVVHVVQLLCLVNMTC